MYDLIEKVALVTGGSRGLGRVFALDLARAGATVVVNAQTSSEWARKTIEEIEALGQRAELIVCDVSEPMQVSMMVDKILTRFKKLDILINNAGISIDGTTVNYDIDAWEKVLKTNLSGAFHCSKYCLPSMINQKWGRIINISSLVGQMGVIGAPAYTASKAGLIGFTKALAKEVARKGITVNCVSLGYFQGGGLLDSIPEKLQERILEKIPIGRWGKPEEICGAINFLVSENASYITGQTIGINGGAYA
jgi:NAD(P)-dependent dehydrogenase (short-subunit alcohol dehydrogenase family)